jgi:Flp pilus assembly protein TadG
MLQTESTLLRSSWILKSISRLRSDEGSGLLEYALIFILSMLLLLGIIDFGRTMYIYHFVSNASREASRWAAVNGSTCNADASCNGQYGMNNGPALGSDIATYVTTITPAGLSRNSPPLTTTASWPVQANGPQTCTTGAGGALNCTSICATTLNAPGCTVEVKVSYTFNFLFPLVYNSPLTLSSSSEMVIAH